MKRPIILFVVALVAAPALAVDASQDLAWWGPTDVSGWHIRIPVTVTNPMDVTVHDARIVTQLDIKQALLDGGWINSPGSNGAILQSFELDPASIRVVEVTNHEASKPGSSDGVLVSYDRNKARSDPDRYSIPVQVETAGLDTRRSYDARLDPIVTLTWQAKGAFQNDTSRYFVAYLDTTSSPAKPLAKDDPIGTAMFGPGPHTTLYGYAPAPNAGPTRATLWGLHDHTNVTIEVYRDGQFRPVPATETNPNPFVLDREEIRQALLATGDDAVFRVLADRPVLGYVAKGGFVPSLTGGHLGNEFLFEAPGNEQDTLTMIADHGKPTVAEVSNLDGTTSFTVHLNDADHPYPYTRGARIHGFYAVDETPPCEPIARFEQTPLLPPGTGNWKVEVIEGGPVTLQLAPGPDDERVQVPAVTGAPVGADHWYLASWSDENFAQLGAFPGCFEAHRNIPWQVAAVTGTTAIKTGTPERVDQVDPSNGHRIIPAAPLFGPESITPLRKEIRDIPLHTTGDRDAWVFLGDGDMRGPLSGPSGRVFAGDGDVVVIAPYDGTQVTFTDSEGQTSTHGIRKASALEIESDATWRLESTRPVMVYPTGAAPTFLAGTPMPFTVQSGAAQFWGPLLDLQGAGGADPVSGSTFAGATITYGLTLSNLATDANGDAVADRVDVKASAPDGWTATIDRPSIRLDPAATESIRLSVTPADGVANGALGVVTVRATSQTNAGVEDSVDVITFLKRSFDVGIWFDQADGPKEQVRITSEGNGTRFDMVVVNRGSVTDTYNVRVAGIEPGWDVLVLDDQGRDRDEITLQAGGAQALTLDVTPPPDTGDAVAFHTVTVTSQASPAATDRAVATTKIRPPSDVRLTVDQPGLVIPPGQEGRFPVQLSNSGQGSAEVVFDLRTDTRPDWLEPRVDLALDRPITIERITLLPGESVPLEIVAGPPAHAAKGASQGIRLEASVAGTGQILEGVVHAVTAPHHDLLVDVAPVVLMDRPQVTLDAKVTNQGNLPEVLKVTTVDAPPGWNITGPEVILLRNGTADTTFTIMQAPGTPPGTYPLTLGLVSQDGTVNQVALNATVQAAGLLSASRLVDLDARPGAPVTGWLRIDNHGNRPLQVVIGGGAPWAVQPGSHSIAPADHDLVPVTWMVPRDATDGPVTINATINGHPEQDIRAVAHVGRPDLRLTAPLPFEGPTGPLVRVQVVNDGDRDAGPFNITTALGDEVLDLATIGVLRPGAASNLTLAASPGATIMVDPDDRVVEVDETNNALAMPVLNMDTPLPSLGALLSIAAAFLVAVARRRT